MVTPLLFVLGLQGPAQDPRLSPPTRLAMAMEPIETALRIVGQARSVSLEVAPVLKNRKVSVYTEEERAGSTLERLAEVLDATWVETHSRWRLDPVPERLAEASAYLKLREELVLAEARENLERMAVAAKRPFPEVAAEAEAARKAGAEEKDPAQAESKFLKWRQLGSGDYMSYLAGAVYRSLSPDERGRFWNGEMFVGSTAAGPAGHPLPGGAENWGEAEMSESLAERGDTRLFVRFHPVLGQIQQRILRASQNGCRMVTPIPYVESAVLKKHPFRLREQAWNQPAAFDSRRVKPLKKLEPVGKGRWSAGYWSVGDVLGRLHARTGLPIVALVTREPYAAADPDTDIWTRAAKTDGPGTLGGALAALAAFGRMQERESDGYLLARSTKWVERLAVDPPEDLVRSFEAISAPTLDDGAKLADRLTDLQAYCLGRPDVTVCLKDATILDAARIEALRLWASLAPEQKRGLLGGKPLPATSLSEPQSRRLEQALIGAVLSGAPVPDLMRRLFDGVDRQALRGLSIWASAESVQEPFVNPPRTASRISEVHLQTRPGLVLNLGPSPEEGIRIDFATPPTL